MKTLLASLPHRLPGPSRVVLAGALALAAGCMGEAPLAPFRATQRTAELLAGNEAAGSAIQAELERLFGQPADPHFGTGPGADGFDPAAAGFGEFDERLIEAVRIDNRSRYFAVLSELEKLPGDQPGAAAGIAWPTSLADLAADAGDASPADLVVQIEGSLPSLAQTARSYSRQCVTCHGVGGAGDGPSAHFQNPPPRDYGAAEFRHMAGTKRSRPAHTDLLRVLRDGIAGSGMPRFASRPAAELSGLADYVRFLAVRGEVERALVDIASTGGQVDPAAADRAFAAAVAAWRGGDA